MALTPEEAARVKPFYLGMLSGDDILVDEGGFFASALERLEHRLQELGSRRYVDEDDDEYWDLKPDWKPGEVVELGLPTTDALLASSRPSTAAWSLTGSLPLRAAGPGRSVRGRPR